MNQLPCLTGIPADALGYVRLDDLDDDRLLALFGRAETVCLTVPNGDAARRDLERAAMDAAAALFSLATPAQPFGRASEPETVHRVRTALADYFRAPVLVRLQWEAPEDESLLTLACVAGDELHRRTVAFATRGCTQADVTDEDVALFRLPL